MNGFASINAQDASLSERLKRPVRCWPLVLLGLLALLFFLPNPVLAETNEPAPAAVCSSRAADQLTRPPLVASVLDVRNRLSHPGLANRRVMLQIGVVGMCIALYIIIWRR